MNAAIRPRETSMAVDLKPNDPSLNDLTWAESNNVPAAEGSDLPEKPSNAFLADGYGNKDVLPHAQFNWLIRSMMRWIRWLVSKVDGHVHDGGSSPGSVAKVNATNLAGQINHLDWGANGTFGTTTNSASVHEITHGGGAATRRIVTGQLHAPTHVRTATIQSNGTGPASPVNIRDSDGSNGLLNSAIVQTNEIRRTAAGGTINVRDSGGNNTTLNVNRVTQETSTIYVAGTTQGLKLETDATDGLTIKSTAQSNLAPLRCSSINATNVPKYTARIKANGTPDYSFLATSGSVTVEKTAVDSSSGQGEYTFTFPFTNRVAIITLLNARGFVSYNRLSNNQIRVFTTNTSNNFTDRDFAIVVF
jgi:hypothetical protein